MTTFSESYSILASSGRCHNYKQFEKQKETALYYVDVWDDTEIDAMINDVLNIGDQWHLEFYQTVRKYSRSARDIFGNARLDDENFDEQLAKFMNKLNSGISRAVKKLSSDVDKYLDAPSALLALRPKTYDFSTFSYCYLLEFMTEKMKDLFYEKLATVDSRTLVSQLKRLLEITDARAHLLAILSKQRAHLFSQFGF
jgi:hypothetical protein